MYVFSVLFFSRSPRYCSFEFAFHLLFFQYESLLWAPGPLDEVNSTLSLDLYGFTFEVSFIEFSKLLVVSLP